MIDFFNVNNNALNNQIFYTKGSTDFQTWSKPANVKFVNIFVLGAGGGGGAGSVNTSGSARRGGGGGGSAGYSLGFFAASQIPDELFLSVPTGGAGGIGGATVGSGGTGALAYVSVAPDSTAINILLSSGTAVAGGGVGGGNGGVGSTIWTGAILNNLGFATVYAGTAGANSAISAIGASITPAGIVCGGASGGNTSTTTPFQGGDITGSGFLNTITGGTGGASTTAGTAGSGGYTASLLDGNSKRQPIFFTGGAGGGASQGGQGGEGGAAAYGCGGGGGGAGVTALGGAGGRGGDGLIIITAW